MCCCHLICSGKTNVFGCLNDFVLQMKELQNVGYKQLYMTNKAFIYDAPARAFIKCIMGHSSYHSCKRCILLETTALLSIVVTFKSNFYKEGHQVWASFSTCNYIFQL